MFERGALRRPQRSAAAQVARLWLGNIGPWLRLSARGLRGAIGRGVRSGWMWTVAIVAGMLLRVAPSRAAVARGAASVGAWLLGLRRDRLAARGLDSIDPNKPAVLMVNRSGPADLPALAAALPFAVFPVDYRAVSSLPGPLQFLFAPLVTPPVDGETSPPGGTLRQRIEQALGLGAAVVVFADVPIGTPPARSRFRLEAIEAARAVGAPVFPVFLNSTAVFDGGGQGSVTVAVGAPIHPAGSDPRQLVEWRDEIRRAITQLGDSNVQAPAQAAGCGTIQADGPSRK